MLHLSTPDWEQGLYLGIVDRQHPAHVYSTYLKRHLPCLNLTTGAPTGSTWPPVYLTPARTLHLAEKAGAWTGHGQR